jgi:hypothetical protein
MKRLGAFGFVSLNIALTAWLIHLLQNLEAFNKDKKVAAYESFSSFTYRYPDLMSEELKVCTARA